VVTDGASAARSIFKSQKTKARGYCRFFQNPNGGAYNKQKYN
jgi:hypothetical protein